MIGRLLIGAAVAGLFLGAGHAVAGEWFVHPFGELRAYHGDWLAVCDDKGEGRCRAVHSERKSADDRFFGKSRVALLRIDDNRWAIEFHDEGLSASELHSLAFTVDGKTTPIPQGALKIGTPDVDNVADTVTIMDATLAGELVAKMRAGNRLIIDYQPSATDGKALVSLRGATAVTDAIEAQIRDRTN
ncbi:hypothetical protein [Notoacmeibacter marinus]|uniref:hypothetical protein n=1 Tax=Notoacmeibacter marinus TaxID=1876515 RepID=UPI000DF14186|nr:hypothetical protein [Notoacmeibacter marinus]